MDRIVQPAGAPLSGALRVPGDKSVSHRAVIFAAMAEGTSSITGLLDSEDVAASLRAVEALGARVDRGAGAISITGWGTDGPSQPDAPIDCGNSGTTVRLLAGVVAGWPISVTFTGDASLSSRPMGRVADPLSAMGARITTTDGCLPMTVGGGDLVAIEYASPVASAQVKSSILLAGLRASGRTSVREPALSRDHTERMLPGFAVELSRSADGLTSSLEGPASLFAGDVVVPGDPSSAAFFAAVATVLPGSAISLDALMLNPTRMASFEVLARMGSLQAVDHRGTDAGEATGSVSVASAPHPAGVHVPSDIVPALIDEVPVLAVAATRCTGVTRFDGVGELRVKESDRLEAVASALELLGANVRWGEDWLEVDGPTELQGGTLDARGDHRLAMAFHVAGLLGVRPVTVRGYEAVAVSYPGFAGDMDRLSGVSPADEGRDA